MAHNQSPTKPRGHSIIAWRTPPAVVPFGKRVGEVDKKTIALKEELQRHPGEWAYVGIRKSTAFVAAVRKGKSVWGPAGAFEARAVRDEDGDFDIYVRFVGATAVDQ